MLSRQQKKTHTHGDDGRTITTVDCWPLLFHSLPRLAGRSVSVDLVAGLGWGSSCLRCWMDAAVAAWWVGGLVGGGWVVGGGLMVGWMCETDGRGGRYQKTKPSFAIPNEHIIFIVAARKVRGCCSYAKSRANTADGDVSAALLSPRLGNDCV